VRVAFTVVWFDYGGLDVMRVRWPDGELHREVEGITWIHGHHDAGSEEVRALLAAYRLWRQ
jgi:hypothetical protein